LSKTTTHIAVIRLSAMGDVAMTVPVIRALVQQHPTVQLTIVSRPFFAPFFAGLPNVTFFAVDVKGRHQGFTGLLRLYADLRRLEIDSVADLHNVLRSKIVRTLFTLSGKRVAFTDKGRADKKALTRAVNKVFEPVRSMFERHVDTFGKLGYSVDLAQPVFPVPVALEAATTTVSGSKEGFSWIGIAPFAQYESKVYPLDLMEQVVAQLAETPLHKVFLFGGGAKEIAQLKGLAADRANVILVAGKLSLPQELQLISQLDVMVSMDSGNAHIAAMLGVTVLTLWGATHPYAGFKPFNQPMERCLVSDREQFPLLPTSVYGNKKIAGYEAAMRTIAPEAVLASIHNILK
jgi:ADP-heptose:LPS heptosyltransferase